jgi:hypothetical protein
MTSFRNLQIRVPEALRVDAGTSFGFVKIDEKCGLAVFDAGNSPATGRLFNLGGNGAVYT